MKFVRRDLVCFTDIRSASLNRCQDILKVLAEMITTSGTGWELDSRCPTTTSFLNVNCGTSGNYPFLLFRNTTSGCKLYVSCTNIATQSNWKYTYCPQYNSYDCCYNVSSSYSTMVHGIAMSIIPKDSSSEFPSEITDNTVRMPIDATRIVGDCMTYQTSTSAVGATYFTTIIYNLGTANIYSLGLLLNEETIIYFSSYSTTQTRAILLPQYAVGKIFGKLAHELEDTSLQAKYGVIKFCYSNSTQSTREMPTYWSTFGCGLGNNANPGNLGCFCKADGTWCYYTNTVFGVLQGELLASNITNSTSAGITRWCPYGAASSSGSPSNSSYYIVEGDSFKGYLDTDLFRAAVSVRGNYYNNGQFVAVGANLLVQWDTLATDNLR